MERVTMAEAARALDLNKSTVTRWVAANPALRDPVSGLVSIEELAAHRAMTVNPKLQTRTAPSRNPDEVPTAAAPRESGLNANRNRAEAAKADSAELDLAERLGMTLRRDEVESAVMAAGEIMKQTAQQLAKDRAEQMTRIDDVREMERALEDLMREVLIKGGRALSLAAVGSSAEHAA